MNSVIGWLSLKTKIDNNDLEKQIADLEADLEILQSAYEKVINDPKADPKWAEDYKKDIRKVEAELDRLRKKQIETNKNASNGLNGVLSKMTKWGLAIFGIRSAYMLIRQSASQLAQENDEIAAKINAIRGSLTNLIAPVVEVLVDLVYRLLSYVNVITKTFLGVDLFKKSAKSAKSAVGSAKQLSKTLAGFDEMNIVNGNSSAGGGAGTGGGAGNIEPIDTSDFQKTVNKYKKMWDDLLDIDRAKMQEMLLEQDKTWGLLKLGWFDTIQGIAFIVTGFVDVFGGVFKIIKGIADDDEKEIEGGVDQLVEGIGEMFKGLVQRIIGLNEELMGIVFGLGAKVGEFIREKVIKPINDKLGSIGLSIDVLNLPLAIGKKVAEKILNKIDTIKKRLKENFKDGFWKGIANTLIDIMNSAINKINDKFKISIGKGTAKLLNGLGIKVSAGEHQIVKIPKIPRLRKGALLNLPGNGVPIGIGGEAGREGLIPLDNEHQMRLIGESIGKYVTIDLTNITKLDSRELTRIIKQINSENTFLRNR